MAIACDRAADLRHPVGPCLGPCHASLFHAACDDVITRRFDGAAADGKAGGAIDVISHPVFVVSEVIDLPLGEAAVVPVLSHVTELVQFLEELQDFPVPVSSY